MKPIKHHRSRGPIFDDHCREDSAVLAGAVETVLLASGSGIFPYRSELISRRGAAHETVCYCGPRASPCFCLTLSASLPFHWFAVAFQTGPKSRAFLSFVQPPMSHAHVLLHQADDIHVFADESWQFGRARLRVAGQVVIHKAGQSADTRRLAQVALHECL